MSEPVAEGAGSPRATSLQDAPPTPPTPEDIGTDSKSSRKREREVSVEPATPKADEPTLDDTQERRTPAPKKKNRVKLGTTAEEEDETPPESESPKRVSMELSTSPPYETKVRQISRKVRGMKWDDKERTAPEFIQDRNASSDVAAAHTADIELAPAAEITSQDEQAAPPPPASTEEPSSETIDTPMEPNNEEAGERAPDASHSAESDSDDQDKGLKRKISERQTSASFEERPSNAGSEASKRARDDNEEDVNPREKKRPTPPPEEDETEEDTKADLPKTPESEVAEPIAPQPKIGGFLAYASSSSPFAATKGPSVFGQKSTPSPSPLAGTSNGTASSLSSAFGMKPSSPFAIPSGNKSSSNSVSVFGSPSTFSSRDPNPPNNISTSPTGTKRSGFEAFASNSSPFAAAAAARSKSPLSRSKSPTRRSTASSINAFKSYASSGTSSFAAPSPPVKKQRQDVGDDAENGKAGADNVLNSTSNRESPEGSEGEETEGSTFTDRLRAGQNVLGGEDGSEEDEKVVAIEKEVQTGEEDEDTLFQVRGKLYALSDQNSWKERGTGLLRLNVRKSDGGGARLVMRKEAVFALLLNVTLFKGMRCTLAQDPRYVRFSCIEAGSTVHYNLRLSNAKVSAELIEEINANIPSDDPSNAV